MGDRPDDWWDMITGLALAIVMITWSLVLLGGFVYVLARFVR